MLGDNNNIAAEGGPPPAAAAAAPRREDVQGPPGVAPAERRTRESHEEDRLVVVDSSPSHRSSPILVPSRTIRPTELVRETRPTELASAQAQVDASIAASAHPASVPAAQADRSTTEDARLSTNAAQQDTAGEESPDEDDDEDPDEWTIDGVDLSHVVEDMMDPIMGKDDPDRMKVNSLELECIMDVRAAIESDPETDNLSDFIYSQIGIVCQQGYASPSQRIVEALRRARGLQKYRQDFDIADTYEEGCRALKAFVELFAGHNLAWTFSEADGTWIWVFDASKVDSASLTTEAKLKAYFAGLYYIFHALSPDLQTIRKGPITLGECAGVGGISFQSNFRFWFQLADRFHAYYPILSEAKFYHTSAGFNHMISIIKTTMIAQDTAERIQVGLHSETPLDALFLVPNCQVATARVLSNMTNCLKRRYDNDRQFSIPRTRIQRGIGA